MKMITSGRIKLALFVLALLALLLPDVALAAPNLFPATVDDLSIKLLLNQFFGGAMPGATGNGTDTDPFVSMLRVINIAALTIGGLMASYTLVAGTMQTAHDGEVLGKKWSSMWLPIRTVLGVGLVVPLGSGYCVAQMVVMWLAVQGVGLANQVWTAFAEKGLTQLTAYASAPSPKAQDLAINALKIQICMEVFERMSQMPESVKINGAYTMSTTPIDRSNGLFRTGDKIKGTSYGTSQNETQCGTVKRTVGQWEGAATAAGAVVGGKGGALIGGAIGTAIGAAGFGVGAIPGGIIGSSIGALIGGGAGATYGYNSNPNKGLADIIKTHDDGYPILMTEMKKVAGTIVDQTLPNGGSAGSLDAAGTTFDNAVKAYMDRVQAQVASSNGDMMTTLQQNATSGGWMMAGAWFTRMAAAINGINQAVNMVPAAEFNQLFTVDESLPNASQVVNAFATMDKFYTANTDVGQANAWRSNLGTAKAANNTKNANGDKVKAMEENSIAKELVASMSGLDITRLQNDTRHPLITLQELGSSMMQWMAASALSMAVLSTTGAGALIAPLLGLILFSGVAAATTFSIYTPLMPFLLYLGAVFGWFLIVIEAMIAAPLWAIMHLSPAGDDLMGSAKNGYSLLLSLMLRPALIVAGFAASVLIIYPMGMILNMVFFDVFIISATNGGSFYAVFMLIAGTVVYASVLLSLLHKAFSLIHKIPDELLKWFGGGGSSLGQGSQEFAGGSKAAVAQVASTMSNASNQMMNAGQSFRQIGAQKGQQKASLSNAASQSQGAAHQSASKADQQSMQAYASQDPAEHMKAASDSQNTAQGFRQAAKDVGKAGGKASEVRELKDQASHYDQKAADHTGKAGELAQSAAGKADANAGKTPSSKAEASEFAQQAHQASVGQQAMATLAHSGKKADDGKGSASGSEDAAAGYAAKSQHYAAQAASFANWTPPSSAGSGGASSTPGVSAD